MPPALSHQTYWYLRSRLSQRGDVIMIERTAQLDELCAVVGLLGRAIPGGVREASPSWRGSSRPCPLSAASAGGGGSGRTLVVRKAGRIPEGAEPGAGVNKLIWSTPPTCDPMANRGSPRRCTPDHRSLVDTTNTRVTRATYRGMLTQGCGCAGCVPNSPGRRSLSRGGLAQCPIQPLHSPPPGGETGNGTGESRRVPTPGTRV